MSLSSDIAAPALPATPEPSPAQGKVPRAELVRKFLHMSPGLVAIGMSFIPHYDPLAWHEVGIIAGVAIILTVVFLRMRHTVRRNGEDNFLSTVLSYGVCVVTMSALFRGNPEFTSVVVAVLAFGDGSAYLGGKYLGKRKLPWNRSKTWIGTFSFILVSWPLAALAYWLEARPAAPFSLAAACAGAAAVAGAVAESLPMKLTDNLRVGVAAGIACAATYFAITT